MNRGESFRKAIQNRQSINIEGATLVGYIMLKNYLIK
jgi:hypothetical protein